MNKPFEPGEWIVLIAANPQRPRRWIARVGEKFSTADGVFDLQGLIGQMPGSSVASHLGQRLFAFRPTAADWVMHLIKRQTQITYPKEMGYILVRAGIGPGSVVIESGSGSGASTLLFALAVGDNGHVFSYEQRPEFSQLAQQNVARAGVAHRVTFKVKDIAEGFDERDADAVFLDVREPWHYLEHAVTALASGGTLVILVPTTNQVSETLRALPALPLIDLEVVELLLRHYKPNPERLRPEDRMVAHTAFLIFARKHSL
ncbi:MAG: tRNA (adenine-N1)-methyltransferase [Candidatus Bipolaricaulota bacterium]|nr:tRNA (adenine-N1)-methyltransferase [Candidatus Bipolaricaulota bacterium]MDW8030446.1 tRNA (adenine-N1)-methyltransferase [Candidatus Bipolaricaulota bacterium]